MSGAQDIPVAHVINYLFLRPPSYKRTEFKQASVLENTKIKDAEE